MSAADLAMNDAMVERAAVRMATEFGFEWVFESDTDDENYDAAYWRHVARQVLRAALSRESV